MCRESQTDQAALLYPKIVDLTADNGCFFDELPSSVAALGNFDGVHLAHRELLLQTLRLASEKRVKASVFTFRTPKGAYLTDMHEKLRLIGEAGIETVFLADFDRLRTFSPERFVKDILVERMHLSGVVCGFNFRFGKDAAGDADLLTHLCGRYGITVRVLPKISSLGGTLSSSAIRAALREGDPERAAGMLGRPFALCGKVSHGRAVGRRNACPTLNLLISDDALQPKFGVYCTRCIVGGQTFFAVSNIGVRPTFESDYGKSDVLCEVHLLSNFSSEPSENVFYGREIRVELDHFLRPERRFVCSEDLYRQVEEDIRIAKGYYEETFGLL